MPPAGSTDASLLILGSLPGEASLAAQRSTAGSPVTPVDQASGFLLSDLYDGFHPNAGGETKMANRWLEALAAPLP